MIDHYDAFISYKHAPLDSKIADHVQKNLEHFRIPDKIRQKTGKKKIERVFLDKDELPITADLSETISNALKSAEFLIVICSPETKKSVWVQREIEFFLEHHSRNNVLTVLVDGEPFEVIPEILLKEERTVTDEEGREHKVTIDLEPLSCDYRLPINTAKKKELPRLASAIIGCSYDELMDRNRQYRMRRMALIFGVIMSLGIALTVYMFITQAQIKENLLAAKRSRALYLANESTRLYNEMRRIDAIQLALAALPQDNEFDVIPEAERALADSTLAYQPCVGNSIEATWNYNMPHEIRYIGVSPDRETFAAADIGNHVTMWDTETHDVILDTTYGSQIVGIRHLNNDYLAVWSSRNATVYSTSDGEELWDMEFDTSLVHGGYEFSLEYDEKDERLFLLTYEPKLIALDGATGEMVIDCELDYDRDSLYISYEKLEISPSGDRLMAFYKIDGESYIGVVDLDTGEKIEIPVEGVVNNIGWGDDDHILIQTSEEDIGSLSNSDDFSIVRLISTTLICYDSSDLSEVWRNDFSYSDRSLYSGFFPLPARDAVMYYNSDRAIVYNIDTGDIINDYYLSDTIVDASDNDEDGVPLFVTIRGYIVSPQYVEEEGDPLLQYHELVDNINGCVVGGGIYIVREQESQVIFYDLYVSDEEYQVTDDLVMYNKPFDFLMSDEAVVLISTNENSEAEVHIIDPEENEYVGCADLSSAVNETLYLYNLELLGEYDGEVWILYFGDDNDILMAVDSSDASVRTVEIPSSSSYAYSYYYYLCGGYVVFTYCEAGVDKAGIYDIANDEFIYFDLDEDFSNLQPGTSFVYFEKSERVWVTCPDEDVIIDLNDEESDDMDLPDGWLGTCLTALSEGEEAFAVCDNSEIVVYDEDLDIACEISCNASTPIAMAFCKIDDGELILLVAYSDGYLNRYDPWTGDFLGQSQYTNEESLIVNSSITYDPLSGYVYIQINRRLDVIELTEWFEVATMTSCIGHHEPTDRFFSLSYVTSHDVTIGYFEHYTVEDLVDKANEILQGEEISENLRAIYGL